MLKVIQPSLFSNNDTTRIIHSNILCDDEAESPSVSLKTALGSSWQSDDFALAYYLALIALKSDDVALAQQYFRIAESGDPGRGKRYLDILRSKLE